MHGSPHSWTWHSSYATRSRSGKDTGIPGKQPGSFADLRRPTAFLCPPCTGSVGNHPQKNYPCFTWNRSICSIISRKPCASGAQIWPIPFISTTISTSPRTASSENWRLTKMSSVRPARTILKMHYLIRGYPPVNLPANPCASRTTVKL